MIKKNSRISRMRLGQEVPHFADVPSTRHGETPTRLVIVPLTEAEHHKGLAMAAAYQIEGDENTMNIELRDRYMQCCDLFHALRDPDDMTKLAFESPLEMLGVLEAGDINHLGEEYMIMADDSSPALDGLSDEQLEELKKALEALDWSALSGRPWAHLKSFFLTLSATQLRGSLPGSFSMSNLTTRSGESESTPTASESGSVDSILAKSAGSQLSPEAT